MIAECEITDLKNNLSNSTTDNKESNRKEAIKITDPTLEVKPASGDKVLKKVVIRCLSETRENQNLNAKLSNFLTSMNSSNETSSNNSKQDKHNKFETKSAVDIDHCIDNKYAHFKKPKF